MLLLGAYSALLVVALLAGAALAWLVTGRAMRGSRHLPAQGLDAQAALRRHPAGRARWEALDGSLPGAGARAARPVGPDDDQEFLDRLERQIRGGNGPGPGK